MSFFVCIASDLGPNISIDSEQIKGATANEFRSSWEEAKACFNNYTNLITEICNSAQQAGGIYSELEAGSQVSHL